MLKQRIFRYALGFMLMALFISHATERFPIPFIDTIDHQIYDLRLSMTLPEAVDKKVVIVDIDEKSLAHLGRWPWDRKTMSQIVNILFDVYQINVLGFDMVFAEKDEYPSDKVLLSMAHGPLANNQDFLNIYRKASSSLQRDQLFSQSLKNRKTVMGIIFYDNEAIPKQGSLPKASNLSQRTVEGFDIKQAKSYTANLNILQSNAYSAGFFSNPILDDDGVLRKASLLQEYDGKIYESLSLATARASLKNNVLKSGIESLNETGSEQSLEHLYLGDIAIPVDENSGALVPYIGPPHSFDYISAVDIFNNKADKSLLENKIVLFGTSAAGLMDLTNTPLEKSFPGVEIHANIIQGILDQTIKHKPEYLLAFEILLLLLLGTVLTFILPALSPVLGSTLMLLSISSLLYIDHLAWNNWNMLLPITSPLIMVTLLYLLNMTYGFFVESRGKKQLTQLFGKYVPSDLVKEMSKNLTHITLDGEIRNMSVLFTDVRDFTSISENMDPKELTTFINEFLTSQTTVIHQNRGIIDKYMGDAIMAFWGAPLEDHQHAHNSLIASLQMQRAIRELNLKFKNQGQPEIRIGVGISTGDMNVGNKGTEFRMDYTVLGDSVNLASRLENLTKTYGVDILTSDNTRHAAPEFEFMELDRVRVKGKDKPVRIYEPLGLIETIDKPTQNIILQFKHALKLYRAQNWDDAEQKLFSLSQIDTSRKIYTVYLDRIAYFRKNNPGPDWDGVFTFTSK